MSPTGSKSSSLTPATRSAILRADLPAVIKLSPDNSTFLGPNKISVIGVGSPFLSGIFITCLSSCFALYVCCCLSASDKNSSKFTSSITGNELSTISSSAMSSPYGYTLLNVPFP